MKYISRVFGIAWRLAILALPWQTRWIFHEGSVGSSPWEQGTVAVYASWGVLLLAIGTGLAVAWRKRSDRGTRNSGLGLHDGRKVQGPHSKFQLAAVAFAVLLAISLFTSSRTATFLWWSHAVILGLFACTLVRAEVEATSVMRWFVLSLIPHAALGVWQFARQDIIGSTLLGIATQHPWTSGVSVVEHGLYRVLRAYGGFPHPNVFGGWLAVGLT
ncbi:MAG TPA: hypothetical protein VN397_00500, partial [Candidatus Methylomirabilis sp.]|nr:hypothetical protein [Candidatus Methylomirabilis sp.]